MRSPLGALACLLTALALTVGCASRGPAPSPGPEEPRERIEPSEDPRPGARPRPSRPPRPSELEAMSFPETLPIPVDGVESSELVSSFDAPRSGGRRHRAIDIFAPRHTPVRSTTPGYVTKRRTLSLGGKTLSIVGPGGYRHYYAHLQEWADLKVGDFVRAGEIVGYVGNSGNASRGPTHLHYAIYRPWGDPIDPYDYMRLGSGSFTSR